jgi:hypothetical protein
MLFVKIVESTVGATFFLRKLQDKKPMPCVKPFTFFDNLIPRQITPLRPVRRTIHAQFLQRV